uniref:non-structural maintenance of chromosomes element 4 homolog A-like isoform X2 n=1 Tax=Myxine glutinosa TaxID=7769 RepID=UPI00358F3465
MAGRVNGDDRNYEEEQRRREIRQQYRTLMDQIKVNQPREAVLDSQLIVLVASLGNDSASKLQTGGVTFDSSLFAANTLKFLGYRDSGLGLWNKNVHDLSRPSGSRTASPDSLEEAQLNDSIGEVELFPRDAWCQLGREASKYIQSSPTFHVMLGSFTSGPVMPAPPLERIHRVKQKAEPSSMPTRVPQVEHNRDKATEKEMKRVLDILSAYVKKDDAPLGLYEFVIDPNSFSRTIENMFHLSFLVKDGLVSIECGEQGMLRIGLVPLHHERMDHSGNKQMITSLSMQKWKEIIDTLHIHQALIPVPAVFSGTEMQP